MRRRHQPTRENASPPKDTGLRQVLTWTFIALAFAVLFSLLAVNVVFRWFGSGS